MLWPTIIACVALNLTALLAFTRRARWGRRAALVAGLCAVGCLLVGLLGCIGSLAWSFQAVAEVAPEQKAVVLADAISASMRATVVGMVGMVTPSLALFGVLFRPPAD